VGGFLLFYSHRKRRGVRRKTGKGKYFMNPLCKKACACLLAGAMAFGLAACAQSGQTRTASAADGDAISGVDPNVLTGGNTRGRLAAG